MITVRPAAERGGGDFGWLKTRHTFSFDTYHDPKWMHFRTLRVINEDWVAPGKGFPRHPHRDMEIITYVLEGALKHEDSMGNGSVIRPGDAQRMSAGTGVFHAEANPSANEPVHLYQIWIFPEQKGIEPGYEQKSFPAEEKRGRLRVLASADAREGSVKIHQDAALYVAVLGTGENVEHRLEAGRGAWVQVARGSVAVNGMKLGEGDGAGLENEQQVVIEAQKEAEILLFDLG